VSDAAKLRALAVARGRALKRANAFTALLCGGLPAIALALFFAPSFATWALGFLLGLLWANAFEYTYHRFLLHLPGTFFARNHLRHHSTVGSPSEPEHVNLGGSPAYVAMLFVVNGLPVVAAGLLLKLGVTPGMFIGFAVYVIVVEEFHWRIHLGERLPPGFGFAREYHYGHHNYPNVRFNIFLPVWDAVLGSFHSQSDQVQEQRQ
jgi:sterol desaturase/sphingolipid hydroxylase (fatty acid hydroxylase superfamily)